MERIILNNGGIMKSLKALFIVLFISFFAIGCGSGSGGGGGGEPSCKVNSGSKCVDTVDVIESEQWHHEAGGSSGDWTFKKLSDGSTIVDGEWEYDGDLAPGRVVCPFTNGTVTSLDPPSFTATGTAILGGGLSTSSFTLKVEDTGNNNSEYTITFANPDWPSSISGTGTATKTDTIPPPPKIQNRQYL